MVQSLKRIVILDIITYLQIGMVMLQDLKVKNTKLPLIMYKAIL